MVYDIIDWHVLLQVRNRLCSFVVQQADIYTERLAGKQKAAE
jgi:hypothetical protein